MVDVDAFWLAVVASVVDVVPDVSALLVTLFVTLFVTLLVALVLTRLVTFFVVLAVVLLAFPVAGVVVAGAGVVLVGSVWNVVSSFVLFVGLSVAVVVAVEFLSVFPSTLACLWGVLMKELAITSPVSVQSWT